MKEGLKIMNDIIYRKVKKEDYNQLEDIINQVFGLYHYVEHPKVLKAFLKYYLKSCMSEQTFSCVAERDGEVIGVIFGKAKSDYRIITHLPYIMSTIYYSILMQIYCIIFSERNKEYRKLHRIYSEFMKNRKNKFDGVLTLFAVKKSCRGLGTPFHFVYFGRLCDAVALRRLVPPDEPIPDGLADTDAVSRI